MGDLAIKVEDDVEQNYKVYTLRIPYEDLLTVPLTSFDRLQLESKHSKETPVADILLDLQTVVLRIEQKNAAHKKGSASSRTGVGRLRRTEGGE